MNKVFAIMLFSVASLSASAQSGERDVFVPISKYVLAGDSESLSAWFADNLEVTILGKSNQCSKTQARQIMKAFFTDNTPKKFEITHRSGKPPMIYAVGSLQAGGAKYRITILVRTKEGKGSHIQQIKIDKE